MATELTLPTDATLQLLTGAVFAESSTQAFGGESREEKEAIAWSILNMSHFATVKPDRARRGYNTTFGDGTVLGAIRSAIQAYEGGRWRVVMDGLGLKPARELARLVPGDHEHLRLVLVVIDGIGPAPRVPGALASLGNRMPVQFNQAGDSPPNAARQEKIGRFARHTFYAFKPGREAE